MTHTIVRPETEGDEEYLLFGKILLQWGYVESRLISIVGCLKHKRYGLRNGKGELFDMPQGFGAQVALAERGYREIIAMSALHKEAQALLGSLRALHRERVVIVHGSYQGRMRDGYVFSFFSSDKKSQSERVENRYFSHAQAAALLKDIIDANAALASLYVRTWKTQPTLTPQK